MLPNLVTSIGDNAFLNVNGLTQCELPASLVSIGNRAFENAYIPYVTIPAGVTTIGEKAFYGCSNLSCVESLANNVPTLGEDAFSSIGNNATLTVPKGTKTAYESSNWGSYFTTITEKE